MKKNQNKALVILLAAGKSSRFEQDKIFFKIQGIPIAIKSLDTILSLNFVSRVIIVSSKENYNNFDEYIKLNKHSQKTNIILGSSNRAGSFIEAIKFIKSNDIESDITIVHDAARPYASKKLYQKGASELENNDVIIPCIKPTDTVKSIDKSGFVIETLDRNSIMNVQTPQFFKSSVLLNNLPKVNNFDKYTDDSSLLENSGVKIKVIEGEIENIKITTKIDVTNKNRLYGTGIDLHKLISGEHLRIGGIDIDYPYKLKGHSDGDVLIHSIIDSILGAANLGDIGYFFPSSDKSTKDIDSKVMLEVVVGLVKTKGFEIVHIDSTIIAQKPKMVTHIEKMKSSLSSVLKIQKKQISIKSTTTDFIGIIGSEKAICSQSICTLESI